MDIEASVSVSDVMQALEIDELPEGCRYDPSGFIEMTVDIDEDDVLDKQPAPEPIELSDELDKNTVMGLAAAIRRGDTAEAELMLDRLVDADAEVAHWIQVARYSRKARRPEAVEVRQAA